MIKKARPARVHRGPIGSTIRSLSCPPQGNGIVAADDRSSDVPENGEPARRGQSSAAPARSRWKSLNDNRPSRLGGNGSQGVGVSVRFTQLQGDSSVEYAFLAYAPPPEDNKRS